MKGQFYNKSIFNEIDHCLLCNLISARHKRQDTGGNMTPLFTISSVLDLSSSLAHDTGGAAEGGDSIISSASLKHHHHHYYHSHCHHHHLNVVSFPSLLSCQHDWDTGNETEQ